MVRLITSIRSIVEGRVQLRPSSRWMGAVPDLESLGHSLNDGSDVDVVVSGSDYWNMGRDGDALRCDRCRVARSPERRFPVEVALSGDDGEANGRIGRYRVVLGTHRSRADEGDAGMVT